ncbi:MAG: glycogen debranching protein, partial [Acidobacteriota bacterium]|nr:glycogen debranching protein [Acidobacteriota bacterium]
MVLTPALRGLFGIEADALRHSLSVHPQIPATWDSADLRNVPVGGDRFDLKLRRSSGKLIVEATSPEPQILCLNAETSCTSARSHRAELSLPAIEMELPHSLPHPGTPTRQSKVISQVEREGSATFELEGQGSETLEVPLRLNRENVKVSGAAIVSGIVSSKLRVAFPAGEGYQTRKVTFTW